MVVLTETRDRPPKSTHAYGMETRVRYYSVVRPTRRTQKLGDRLRSAGESSTSEIFARDSVIYRGRDGPIFIRNERRFRKRETTIIRDGVCVGGVFFRYANGDF